MRPDAGGVFENYIVAELKKKYPTENLYFWRNFDQREVDVIMERDGELSLFEIKRSSKKMAKIPRAFEEAYRPAKFEVINAENYLRILSGEE